MGPAARRPPTLINLEALGLLPQPEHPANRRDRGNGRATPAAPEDQHEFERLMARAGVVPRRGGEELIRCPSPDHEDRRPSCSVNWLAAVFHCHSCGVGGGMGVLRRLTGQQEKIRPEVAKTVKSDTAGLDVERERMRLVTAVK